MIIFLEVLAGIGYGIGGILTVIGCRKAGMYKARYSNDLFAVGLFVITSFAMWPIFALLGIITLLGKVFST